MSQDFYRAFEDRHRGSRALIKARLGAYLPFLAPLPQPGHAPRALDLGCGRGEWLELLAESGFEARGVDLDQGMLAACRERALAVEHADALVTLQAAPDASLDLVSAFHLVEHIDFDLVRQIASEALRALCPGGLLIMETPNPENLVVASSGFHMDPSHLKPLPPPLLDFVVEFSGFARHKVVRLQEAPHVHDAAPLALMTVLDGVSPDYGVVAQKAAPEQQLAPFDAAFEASYGVELGALAERFEQQREARFARLEGRINAVEGRASIAARRTRALVQRSLDALDDARAAALDAGAAAAEARSALQLATLRQQQQAERRSASRVEQLAEQLAAMQTRATQAEQALAALYASTSWRCTHPLRALSDLARSPRQALSTSGQRLRRSVHLLVLRLASYRPARALAQRLMARSPMLNARMRSQLASSVRQLADGAPAIDNQAPAGLSRATQKIYNELQSHRPDPLDR